MKKFFILLLIFALFIGCVNVDLNGSYVDDINTEYAINENYMYSDNLNESVSDDDLNSLELNTAGVIMSDNEYSCGSASFATVLNNIGVNITLDETNRSKNLFQENNMHIMCLDVKIISLSIQKDMSLDIQL